MHEEEAPAWVDDAANAANDPMAFARLVERFEGSALALAWSRLGDRGLAEDVAQEAFVEAFLHLAELREPRAFPAWLRRIVVKHCDRVTRRQTLQLSPLDEHAVPAPEPRESESDVSTDALLVALDALPAGQRQVVALAYLGGLEQASVAALLGIPLTAVKARLRRARNSIRRTMMENDAENTALNGSGTGQPGSAIARLFHALRRGDTETVRTMLAEDPSLAAGEEDWSEDEARRFRLGFPQHGTPLIRAIERDETEVVDALIAAGADVNQVCGCKAGEPPLWTAAVHGRLRLVQRLLSTGADPNGTAFRGVSPLHIASMRGDEAIVRVLLEAGATQKPDLSGRTPADWARANGYQRLATSLPTAARGEAKCIETGIKAIDLLAPLPESGLIRIASDQGLGLSVLLGELGMRFRRRHGWQVTWTGFAQQPGDVGDIAHLLAEMGASSDVQVRMVDRGMPPEDRREALRRTIEESVRAAGGRLLLVVFEEDGLLADTESVYGLLANAGCLALLVSPIGGAGRVAAGDAAPFSGSITFDRSAAKDGRFPAIAASSFSRTETPWAGVAHRAKAMLSGPESPVQRQLQAYLTQPFFGTEPFTGTPGAWVDAETTAQDVARILDGKPGDRPAETLRYIGALEAIAAGADA